MKQISLLLTFFISCLMTAQPCDTTFHQQIQMADLLYQQREFKSAAQLAHDAMGRCASCATEWNYYQSAGYNALAGNREAAFQMLDKAIEMGYHRIDHVVQDPDLRTLESDERWIAVLEGVKQNNEDRKAVFMPQLAIELEAMLERDEAIRSEVSALGDATLDANQATLQRMKEIDSFNTIRVRQMIDSAGWLGEQHVGSRGNTALFIIIQHSDRQTQEKYLPLMRTAATKGLATKDNLALLEDRVLIRQGQPQIYGSQIGVDENTGQPYLSAVQNPDQLDILRRCAGLEPISDYLEHFGLIWDLESYKKALPGLMKLLRPEN